MKRYTIVLILALVSCLLFALFIGAAAALTTTQAEADRISFARQLQLAHSVMDEIKTNRLCIQSSDFSALSDSLKAKFEDMVESQLAAQNRTFEPNVLNGAKVLLTIEVNGDMGLELKRTDGETHIWKQVSPAPASVFSDEITRLIEADLKARSNK